MQWSVPKNVSSRPAAEHMYKDTSVGENASAKSKQSYVPFST